MVGTWTFSGDEADKVTLALGFRADDTFSWSEQLAPLFLPAGVGPTTCVTSIEYTGTYALSTDGNVNVLSWTFGSGTANIVTGCEDPSLDGDGTSMTADDAQAYVEMGDLPPTMVEYTVSASELFLIAPSDPTGGVARDHGTTFTKSE